MNRLIVVLASLSLSMASWVAAGADLQQSLQSTSVTFEVSVTVSASFEAG